MRSFVGIFCFQVLFSFFSLIAKAQPEPFPPSGDTALSLHSFILGEERTIWVHLPADYKPGHYAYPVLYLLDGNMHFQYASQMVEYLSDYDRNRMPQMIVVAITNIDRGKDLTLHHTISGGQTIKDSFSLQEGGGKFAAFIAEELVPLINQQFRTEPYNILMGHSLAGQLALYCKNRFPLIFQSIILISPAIHDGNEKLISDFGRLLKKPGQPGDKMFISLGNEGADKVNLLTREIKKNAPTSFQWEYKNYPEENHFSVTYKSIFDALKFMYKNWFIDNYSSTLLTYNDIRVHYKKLSGEFGYDLHPPEDFLNNYGYKQLNAGNRREAILIFKEAIVLFPDSWNAYDSMGEAYMKNGDRKEAIASYERSVELNPSNEGGRAALKKLRGM